MITCYMHAYIYVLFQALSVVSIFRNLRGYVDWRLGQSGYLVRFLWSDGAGVWRRKENNGFYLVPSILLFTLPSSPRIIPLYNISCLLLNVREVI